MPAQPPPERRGNYRRDYDMVERLLIAIGRPAAAKARFHRRHQVTPEYTLLPEVLVVADGFLGGRLLKQVRDRGHLSVYWPGRGEPYLYGHPVARVTILSGGRRLCPEERSVLRSRLAIFGKAGMWLELEA